jgi:hypothetical protein
MTQEEDPLFGQLGDEKTQWFQLSELTEGNFSTELAAPAKKQEILTRIYSGDFEFPATSVVELKNNVNELQFAIAFDDTLRPYSYFFLMAESQAGLKSLASMSKLPTFHVDKEYADLVTQFTVNYRQSISHLLKGSPLPTTIQENTPVLSSETSMVQNMFTLTFSQIFNILQTHQSEAEKAKEIADFVRNYQTLLPKISHDEPNPILPHLTEYILRSLSTLEKLPQ